MSAGYLDFQCGTYSLSTGWQRPVFAMYAQRTVQCWRAAHSSWSTGAAFYQPLHLGAITGEPATRTTCTVYGGTSSQPRRYQPAAERKPSLVLRGGAVEEYGTLPPIS